MIDHIYLPVIDLKHSDTFYGGTLGPLGMSERWHFKAQSDYLTHKTTRASLAATRRQFFQVRKAVPVRYICAMPPT